MRRLEQLTDREVTILFAHACRRGHWKEFTDVSGPEYEVLNAIKRWAYDARVDETKTDDGWEVVLKWANEIGRCEQGEGFGKTKARAIAVAFIDIREQQRTRDEPE